jgi:hypothetical protein
MAGVIEIPPRPPWEWRIEKYRPDTDGLGFIVTLACGHEVWWAIEPAGFPGPVLCTQCFEAWVAAEKEKGAQQRGQNS